MNDVAMVKILLRNRADFSLTNTNKQTALSIAQGKISILKSLIEELVERRDVNNEKLENAKKIYKLMMDVRIGFYGEFD